MAFKNVEKIITSNGWKLTRITGSHYQYQKAGCALSVVIPNHGGKDLSIGVIKNLEKITGLSLR